MKAKRILSLVLAMIMVMSLFAYLPVSAADDSLILHFDFNDLQNGTIADTTGNITVTTSNGTTNGMKDGETAMTLSGVKESFTWMAKDYDPFAQADGGLTITMWVKNATTSGWRHIFNYGNSANRFTGNYVFLQQQDGGGIRINTSFNNVNYDNKQVGQNLSGGMTSAGVNVWKMLTFTEDGNGNWKVYEDNALAATWNGESAGAYSIAEINDQVNAYDVALGSDGARYSLGAPQWNLWDNDAGLTGAMQSFSIYKGVKTADEIAAMYSAAVGMDQTAVNSVIELINTAKNAEAGSAAQLTAYNAAVDAYEALNALEKDAVTNYADLEAVKNAYIANSGVILGFDFNGNYNEVLNRVSFKNTNQTTITDTAAEFNGADIDWWTKTMGFEHRSYPFFDQTTGDLTIEQIVKADAYDSNNALFGLTWGENQYIKVLGLANGVLRLNFKQEGQSSITINSEEGALEAGEWQTISLVQKKVNDATSTVIYVDGKPAITTTEIMALADLSITHDDLFSIGATDHDAHNVFDGLMDSFYVYNYAKEFAGDYSAVEAAKDAVPDDLDVAYTEATAQAVRDAIANVTYGLTAADQAEIDAYAQAIKDALDALELKTLDLDLTISDAVVVANDEDAYNITWNANVVLGEGVTFDDINNSGATFTEYGVIYGTSETAVAEAATAGADTNTAKIKAFAEGDDIDVYTIFGFRLKNVGEGKERAAMFYVTYEMNGHTFTIYSPVAGGETIA